MLWDIGGLRIFDENKLVLPGLKRIRANVHEMRTVCRAAASGAGREGRKEDLPAVRHMDPAGPGHRGGGKVGVGSGGWGG